jgi:Protein of unknown function, DUF481
MHRRLHLLFFTTLILMPLLSEAQKTDTVVFYNGDRAICEIESLHQGKLLIKTVAMGTIAVEWRKVSSIISKKYFEIILSDKSTFYGSIEGIDSLRNAILHFGIFVQSVPMEDIVKLSTISSSFWRELDGSISLGLSYTQGTENLQLNSAGDATFRNIKTVHTLSYNSNISANTTSTSEKQDAGYRFQYYYKSSVFSAFDFRWERNTELGISSRMITTLSMGFDLVNSHINILSFEAGGSGNREFSIDGGASNNLEGLIRVKYDLFIFTSPKLFISFLGEVFPSFTIKNRVRTNIDGSIKWEIFNDFTFNIAFWGNWDTQPVAENALNFDWGTTTSIGYKF